MLKMRLTGHERINRITRTNDDTAMHKVNGISPIVDMINTGDPMASARLMTELVRSDNRRMRTNTTTSITIKHGATAISML